MSHVVNVMVVITLLAATPSCRGRTATVGGKTASEVFRDERVAALANAAAAGDVKEVGRLAIAGAPVNGVGKGGVTPLAFAILAKNRFGVEALLKHGANPNFRMPDETWVGGYPVMMLLSYVDLPEILEAMLQHGADPNPRIPVQRVQARAFPYEGDSLLIKASMGSIESVRVLIKYGADVNLRPMGTAEGVGGSTAAEAAAAVGRLDIVELLLGSGARDYDQIALALQMLRFPPKHEGQRIAILRSLRSSGAKIYASQANPQTPADLIDPGTPPPYRPSTTDRPVKIPDELLK